MKYYFDTVAARKMTKYLDRRYIKENCFTSIHVICELLTDLDDRNFFIKKNTLNKLFENDIFIDWDQPHKKHFESFGFFNVKYNIRKDNVSFFYEKIKVANGLNDFHNIIADFKEEYGVIQNYDKAFDSYFRKEMALRISDFKNIFSYAQATDFCDKIIESIKNTEEGYLNFLAAMYVKMAEDLYDSELNKYEKRAIDKIIESYNGQIDVFLIVSGIYSLTKVPRKEEISRNDFNDLYHLMYIDNNILVSDDNIFNKYLKGIFPEKIVSCNNFIDKAGL